MGAGLQRFRHIAIEGPIGAGKSSLARKLAARLGADLLLEQAEENPFLGRFYADMPGYAFQTQLHFLFQRVRQMQGIAQPGMFAGALVSDFLFAKDALFARLNLSDDEYEIYRQLHAQVAGQFGEPDLVLWLQATPATLLQRIQRRGIGIELGISADYLQRLCDAYVNYFRWYAGAPVFVIGTEDFNPVENNADFNELLVRLAGFGGPREYFHSFGDAPLA